MSIRVRLYLLCVVLIAVLMTPAISGLRHLHEMRYIAVDYQSRTSAALRAAASLETELAALRLEYHRLLGDRDSAAARRVELLLVGARQPVTDLRAHGYEPFAERFEADLDALEAATVAPDSLSRWDVAGAPTALQERVDASLGEFEAHLQALFDEIGRRSLAATARAQAASEAGSRTVELGTGVAGGLAVLLAVIAIGGVVQPIQRLRSAMSAVAGGRFIPPEDLPYEQQDEIGDLSRSFRSMTARLAELDRLKAEFVGIASHELKTPASVIRGYAEMMEDDFYGPVTERQRGVLDQIKEQTSLLTERVNQLLSVSRLEARGLTVQPRTVPTSELLGEMRAAFEPIAARKEITLRVEAEASAPPTVTLDTDRVQNELFGNLLSNAFKFTPPGGEVRLVARGEDGHVVFEIEDTGAGIPASELPYVFEKYYQAGTHVGKVGAGLGLAIAREVVEAHGGRIEAESEPGKGTVFHVVLPVRSDGGSPLDGGAGEAGHGSDPERRHDGGSRGSVRREPLGPAGVGSRAPRAAPDPAGAGSET